MHKPCSVLCYEWQPFIYVFPRSNRWLRFAAVKFPYQIWVSRLRGLPVPPFSFPKKLVSVALLKEFAIAKQPQAFSSRQLTLPGFMVSSSTNTTFITERASMDFPLTNGQRLPQRKHSYAIFYQKILHFPISSAVLGYRHCHCLLQH